MKLRFGSLKVATYLIPVLGLLGYVISLGLTPSKALAIDCDALVVSAEPYLNSESIDEIQWFLHGDGSYVPWDRPRWEGFNFHKNNCGFNMALDNLGFQLSQRIGELRQAEESLDIYVPRKVCEDVSEFDPWDPYGCAPLFE